MVSKNKLKIPESATYQKIILSALGSMTKQIEKANLQSSVKCVRWATVIDMG